MARIAWAAVALLFVTVPAAALQGRDFLDDTSLNLGLGIGNFTGDLGSLTNAGVSWDGRLGMSPSPYWGGELNYQGIHTSVGGIVTQNGPAVTGQAIVTNEVTIDAQGGYPFMLMNGHQLRPYGFVGIGWAGVSSNSTLSAVGLEASNAFAVPLGVGISYKFSQIFDIDGRFTYNILTGSRSTLAPSGDSWDVGVNVGAHFSLAGGTPTAPSPSTGSAPPAPH